MLDTKDVVQVLPALKHVPPDKAPTRFVSPKEVIEYARAQKLQIVDLKFVDLPGTCSTLAYRSRNWKRACSPRASGLTDRVFGAFRPFTRATCC